MPARECEALNPSYDDKFDACGETIMRTTLALDRAGKRAAAGASRWQRAQPHGAAEAPIRSGVILVDTSIWVDHLRAGNAAGGQSGIGQMPGGF